MFKIDYLVKREWRKVVMLSVPNQRPFNKTHFNCLTKWKMAIALYAFTKFDSSFGIVAHWQEDFALDVKSSVEIKVCSSQCFHFKQFPRKQAAKICPHIYFYGTFFIFCLFLHRSNEQRSVHNWNKGTHTPCTTVACKHMIWF